MRLPRFLPTGLLAALLLAAALLPAWPLEVSNGPMKVVLHPGIGRFSLYFGETALLDDVITQYVLMEKHARDSQTGLLYHGWDESRQQKWADPKTGRAHYGVELCPSVPEAFDLLMAWHEERLRAFRPGAGRRRPRRRDSCDGRAAREGSPRSSSSPLFRSPRPPASGSPGRIRP